MNKVCNGVCQRQPPALHRCSKFQSTLLPAAPPLGPPCIPAAWACSFADAAEGAACCVNHKHAERSAARRSLRVMSEMMGVFVASQLFMKTLPAAAVARRRQKQQRQLARLAAGWAFAGLQATG